MTRYHKSYLDQIESEAIFVLREVAAQFERPALLFSGGKESAVLVHLAMKAFWPGPIPLPLLHVDSGHDFPETLEFRDRLVASLGSALLVCPVQDSVERGRTKEEGGRHAGRRAGPTAALIDGLEQYRIDVAIGGGRPGEETARAQERVLSRCDDFGQSGPDHQRPELWNIFNGRTNPGEHVCVSPLSSWTETDVWSYIAREQIELPALYFAHEREVVERNGVLLACTEFLTPVEGERVRMLTVRFPTLGDATCTGAIVSSARTAGEILQEVAAARGAERETHAGDQGSGASVAGRNRQEYV